MILIGQYDSPFVRRVAVALVLYGFPYEHRPWSTFADAARIAPHNPLRRVPVLLTDDGEPLIESGAILDHLDELAGAERALIARSGPARRQALNVCALASGLADKAVILVYERVLHEQSSAAWVERCHTQIQAVLERLETDRRARPGRYWFGERIGHADIALACALRFLREAHAECFDAARWPQLARHCARCEDLPAFRSVSQPFLPPAG